MTRSDTARLPVKRVNRLPFCVLDGLHECLRECRVGVDCSRDVVESRPHLDGEAGFRDEFTGLGCDNLGPEQELRVRLGYDPDESLGFVQSQGDAHTNYMNLALIYVATIYLAPPGCVVLS